MNAPDRVDRTRSGVLAILVSVLALSFGDAVIKFASADFSLWQIYVLRSMLAVPLLLLIVWLFRRGIDLRPQSMTWAVVRSLLLVFGWLSYYASLPNVPLAVAAAGYYTAPLFITMFAGVFIGEVVTGRAWFAILLGFGGVLVMLRPDADGLNFYALLPIMSAILYALAMVMTRTKCIDENPLVLSLVLNLAFIVIGVIATVLLIVVDPAVVSGTSYTFLIKGWAPLGLTEWLTIGILAIVVVVGSVFAAAAYQSGAPSVIATFDYAYLAFATVWGVLIFSEVPDILTTAGMIMISVAGLIAMPRR